MGKSVGHLFMLDFSQYTNHRVKQAENALKEHKNIDGNASIEDAL